MRFWLIFLLIFGSVLFLSMNRHSKAGRFNYHSELWADKAGYHVYLPAAFIYGFNATEFPEDIDGKTGNGFRLDRSTGKVFTKYTYGVALMHAPFFLAAHLIAGITGEEQDGYSVIYHKAVNIAAAFYLALSLILLYRILLFYEIKKYAALTVSVLFSSTGLFYYSVFETGMSHVYSFFLFTAWIYLLKITAARDSPGRLILLGLVSALILVVRPLNILFFLSAFLILNPSEIKGIISGRKVLLFILPLILVILPQLMYWNYLTGSLFWYSYQEESFSNLFSPRIFHQWFSPNNGLFLYNPVWFVLLFGLLLAGWRWMLFFLIIAWVFASWGDWAYGCSFGSRVYTEYLALFALPLTRVWVFVREKRIWGTFLMSFLLLCILWNIKLSFTWDGCWYGDTWDWSMFGDVLTGAMK